MESWIIEDLRRKKKQIDNRPVLYAPLPEYREPPEENEEESSRGVMIIYNGYEDEETED